MKYFGTDGFRGEANKELTAEHALKVGQYLVATEGTGTYFEGHGLKVNKVGKIDNSDWYKFKINFNFRIYFRKR